nr:uncharacterized protein LOC111424036 isoform X4 [Onthophagus taurus]
MDKNYEIFPGEIIEDETFNVTFKTFKTYSSLIASAATSSNREIQKTPSISYKLMLKLERTQEDFNSKKFRGNLRSFIKQSKLGMDCYNAGGFFEIDFTWFLKIADLTSTYFLIIMSFCVFGCEQN